MGFEFAVDLRDGSIVPANYDMLRRIGFYIAKGDSVRLGPFAVHLYLMRKNGHFVLLIRIERVLDLRFLGAEE